MALLTTSLKSDNLTKLVAMFRKHCTDTELFFCYVLSWTIYS